VYACVCVCVCVSTTRHPSLTHAEPRLATFRLPVSPQLTHLRLIHHPTHSTHQDEEKEKEEEVEEEEQNEKEEQAEEEVVPLLVIGSGRAALTLVSHLPEHMLNGAVVVDPSGEWLETWALRCLRQGVKYLRTPVTQVPFQNCTGLQEFICARGDREADAVQSSARYVPLPSCRVFAEYCAAQTGEHSERFRRVRMLDDTVIVLSHIPPPPGGGGGGGGGAIRVTLSSGQSMVAAQVVHAARWSTPVVPSWMVEARLFSRGGGGGGGGGGSRGTEQEQEQEQEQGLGAERTTPTLATLADVDVRTADVKGRSVVVVGGGMGACSLATAALRHGASRVTLLCRGIIRRREQECDVAYFGNKGLRKFRAVHEPAQRLDILREARGGFATINSQMWMQVQDAVNQNGGGGGGGGDEEHDDAPPSLRVIERRAVERAEWCEGAGKWRVILAPSSSTGGGGETTETSTCTSTSSMSGGDASHVRDRDFNELTADFVWAACGEIVDASRDPVLQNLLRESGRVVGGYPVLVEDDEARMTAGVSSSSSSPGLVSAAAASGVGSLRWPGAPLYFVGAYSSISVGPGAGLPAGHRLAARAVASAMQAHAKECRKGKHPYAAGLSEAQLHQPVAEVGEPMGIPAVLRLVPKSERHRALMDVRELRAAGTDDADAVLPRVELSRYEVIDEAFLIEVRLTLPEAVPAERVRVAFTEQSVEVWAAGDKAAYRFFVAGLCKLNPVVP
jgi:hypothetical protein